MRFLLLSRVTAEDLMILNGQEMPARGIAGRVFTRVRQVLKSLEENAPPIPKKAKGPMTTLTVAVGNFKAELDMTRESVRNGMKYTDPQIVDAKAKVAIMQLNLVTRLFVDAWEKYGQRGTF